MTPTVKIGPRADEDLLQIYIDVGLEDPKKAERAFLSVRARIESLGQFPRSGFRRPELGKGTRVLIEGAYLILYRTLPDTDEGELRSVDVMRVLHGRRDVAAYILSDR